MIRKLVYFAQKHKQYFKVKTEFTHTTLLSFIKLMIRKNTTKRDIRLDFM